MFSHLCRDFDLFWERYPSLRYGLAILLGGFSALQWTHFLCLPVALLFISKQPFKQPALCLFIFLASYAVIKHSHLFPDIPESGKIGAAHIHITSLRVKHTHFGKQWIYHGKLLSFIPEGQSETIAKNIEFTLSLPCSDKIIRPKANRDYQVKAKLKRHSFANYSLSVSKYDPWIPLHGTWSLSEWSFQLKDRLGKMIKKHYRDNSCADFLIGIATGDFNNRMMSYEFGRFGLQHIMAISGFHFAIIASIFSFGLRLFLNSRLSALILMALMSGYCLFLGLNPSIMRAFIAIMIALFGTIAKKKGSGLNSLGVALGLTIAFDPLWCLNIGFQFSFLCTASILLFFGICEAYLHRLLPKRMLMEALQMDRLNQASYCILSFAKEAAALGIAVNITACPMTLFYFQKFPLLSLVYNLFFPFLVSISMLLLMLGFMMPFLGCVFHFINAIFTRILLDFTYNLPVHFDIIWYERNVSISFLIIYLSLLFIGSVILARRFKPGML